MSERDPITAFQEDMSTLLSQAVEQRKTEAGLKLQNSSTSDTDPTSLLDRAKQLVQNQDRLQHEIELIEFRIQRFSVSLREDLERLGVLSPKKIVEPEIDKTELKLEGTPIEVLDLNTPTYNLLKRNIVSGAGRDAQGPPIKYVEQLLGMSEDDFSRIRGFGTGRLKHVIAQLKNHGFLPTDFDTLDQPRGLPESEVTGSTEQTSGFGNDPVYGPAF